MAVKEMDQMMEPHPEDAEKPKRLKILLWVMLPLVLGMAVLIVVLLLREPEVVVVETEPTPEPVGQLEEEGQRPAQTGLTNVDVTWLPNPVDIDATDLELEVPPTEEPNLPEDGDVNDLYRTVRVGTTQTPPFSNCELLLISRELEFSQYMYRIADCREFGGLELFANLSNQVDVSDQGLFNLVTAYDIPDLHSPDELRLTVEDEELVFEKEEFSPATFFANYTEERELSDARSLDHDAVGSLLEDVLGGTFVASRPDHTPQLYRLAFPFMLETDEETDAVPAIMAKLAFSDGTEFEAEYTPVQAVPCQPRQYDMMEPMDDRLRVAGTFADGEVFYETTDPDDPANISGFPAQGVTREERLAEHQFIFWKDALGRTIRLRNTTFFPELENGCPYFNSVL